MLVNGEVLAILLLQRVTLGWSIADGVGLRTAAAGAHSCVLTNVALVESAADGESAGDLAAIILEDINNPTLMDIIVSSSSPGSSEVIAWLALVAKSEAAVLEDNVTTLGEKTTHLLEALLGECVQGIGGDLLAVGDRWGLGWEHGLTELGTSEEVGARVNVWL